MDEYIINITLDVKLLCGFGYRWMDGWVDGERNGWMDIVKLSLSHIDIVVGCIGGIDRYIDVDKWTEVNT